MTATTMLDALAGALAEAGVPPANDEVAERMEANDER